VYLRKMSFNAYQVRGFREGSPLVYLQDIEVVPGIDLKSIRIQIKEPEQSQSTNPESAICELPGGFSNDFVLLGAVRACQEAAKSGTPIPDISVKLRTPTPTPLPGGVIPPYYDELEKGSAISWPEVVVVLEILLAKETRRPDELPTLVFHTVDDLEKSVPPTSTPTV